MKRLLLLLALASPAAAQPLDARAFAARYHYVGGDEEKRKLDEAIETVVQKMNIFVRPIARSRIRNPNQPSAELEVVFDGANIIIRRPGKPEVSAPADGRAIKWKDPRNGDVFTVSHGVVDGVLYQRFEDDRSHTVNRMKLDAAQGKLVVETTTTSKHLPIPLRFAMTYQR